MYKGPMDDNPEPEPHTHLFGYNTTEMLWVCRECGGERKPEHRPLGG